MATTRGADRAKTPQGDAEAVEWEEEPSSQDGSREEGRARAGDDDEALPLSKGRRAKKKRKRGGSGADQVATQLSIFSVVRESPSAIPVRAAQWTKRLKIDGVGAVAEALDAIATVISGSEHRLKCSVDSAWIIQDEPEKSLAEIEKALVDLPEEAVPREQLVSVFGKDRENRLFFTRLENLYCRIASECPRDIVCDTDAFDTILHWLQVLSASLVRELRAVSTRVSYGLLHGFIKLHTSWKKAMATFERQEAIDKKKPHSKDKVERIRSQIEDLDIGLKEVYELIEGIFTGVFVLRYRDVSPEIRAMSIKSLGEWIKTSPTLFLDDSYLKYLGWMLSDKDSRVRLASVVAVRDLLSSTEIADGMELFLSRFWKRIGEMCLDVDRDVALAAIRLCCSIHEGFADIFEEGFLSDICRSLVADDDPRIRNASGSLFSSIFGGAAGVNGKGAADSCEQLLRFANLALGRESDIIGEAVASLFEFLPFLRDWEAYLKILSSAWTESRKDRTSRGSSKSPSPVLGATKISETTRETLVHCLVAALQCVFEERKKSSRAPDETVWEEASLFMARNLSSLIQIHQEIPSVVASLFKAPLFFDPACYKFGGLDREFDRLMDHLLRGYERHSASRRVLDSIASSVRHLIETDHPLRGDVETAAAVLSTSTYRSLHAILRANNVESEDSVALSSAIAKAAHLVVQSHPENLPGVASDVAFLVQAFVDKSIKIPDPDTLNDFRVLVVSTFGWTVHDSRKDATEEEAQEATGEVSDAALSLRDRLVPLLLSVRVSDGLEMSCVALSCACSILALCRSIPSEGASLDARIMRELETRIPECAGEVYFTEDDSLPENLEESRVYELRLSTLASIGQLCLSGTVSERLFHIPLIGLCDKPLGETDSRIFDFSRAYLTEMARRSVLHYPSRFESFSRPTQLMRSGRRFSLLRQVPNSNHRLSCGRNTLRGQA